MKKIESNAKTADVSNDAVSEQITEVIIPSGSRALEKTIPVVKGKGKAKKVPTVTAYGTAIEIMCKNPQLTFPELKKLLAKKGFTKDSAARTAHATTKKVYDLLTVNGYIIKK